MLPFFKDRQPPIKTIYDIEPVTPKQGRTSAYRHVNEKFIDDVPKLWTERYEHDTEKQLDADKFVLSQRFGNAKVFEPSMQSSDFTFLFLVFIELEDRNYLIGCENVEQFRRFSREYMCVAKYIERWLPTEQVQRTPRYRTINHTTAESIGKYFSE